MWEECPALLSTTLASAQVSRSAFVPGHQIGRDSGGSSSCASSVYSTTLRTGCSSHGTDSVLGHDLLVSWE